MFVIKTDRNILRFKHENALETYEKYQTLKGKFKIYKDGVEITERSLEVQALNLEEPAEIKTDIEQELGLQVFK